MMFSFHMKPRPKCVIYGSIVLVPRYVAQFESQSIDPPLSPGYSLRGVDGILGRHASPENYPTKSE